MDPTQAETLRAITNRYKQRSAQFSREAEALDLLGQKIGNLRGLSFLTGVAGLVGYLSQGTPLFLALLAASAVAFVALVKRHSVVVDQQEHKQRLALVNEHGLLRTTNQWQSLPRSGINFAPADHPFSLDLDLFGNASLYQRVCVAHTRFGQQAFAQWLSAPATTQEIDLRQSAVAELALAPDFREKLQALGMALVEKARGSLPKVLSDGPNPQRLLAWAKTREPILQNQMVLALSWILPTVTVGLIVCQVLLSWPPYYWFISVAASMALLIVTKAATTDAFAAVSTTEGAFLHYGELLALLEAHEGEAEWLKSRQSRLLNRDSAKPSAVMNRFRRIVAWYDIRHNGMAYPFFNAFLLWDIHCSAALHRWKLASGAELENWFSVIGDYEAISSLAGLLADDPEATLPSLDEGGSSAPAISATQLGHPLLPCGKRVSNNLEALPLGHALLVTGSNMSGKSTFLRALGVNCVLAFAGGPVIAQKLRLPIVQLGTSIRVSDSLSAGVSHFYAEVQKLALVVRLARDQNRPVLFLLDEVLHGTNSRERQVGARWVLSELLQLGAFGIITTHDMELCRLPDDLMQKVKQHHFRELVEAGEMTFDYTLREGPVTSGNALRLMRNVGLQVPLD